MCTSAKHRVLQSIPIFGSVDGDCITGAETKGVLGDLILHSQPSGGGGMHAMGFMGAGTGVGIDRGCVGAGIGVNRGCTGAGMGVDCGCTGVGIGIDCGCTGVGIGVDLS